MPRSEGKRWIRLRYQFGFLSCLHATNSVKIDLCFVQRFFFVKQSVLKEIDLYFKRLIFVISCVLAHPLFSHDGCRNGMVFHVLKLCTARSQLGFSYDLILFFKNCCKDRSVVWTLSFIKTLSKPQFQKPIWRLHAASALLFCKNRSARLNAWCKTILWLSDVKPRILFISP